MGSVSALRETSVVFAAVIGRVFLQERLTMFRIVACTVVALGAICLGMPAASLPEGADLRHGHPPTIVGS